MINPRLILPPYLVNDFIIPILLFLNDRSCRLQVSILFKGVPHKLPLSVAISVPLLDEKSYYVIDGMNKPSPYFFDVMSLFTNTNLLVMDMIRGSAIIVTVKSAPLSSNVRSFGAVW